MTGKSKASKNHIACIILSFSMSAITLLALFVIWKQPDEGKNIFNIVLPVFASWVGTILAFYYGKDNFESANQQVRELVRKLTPEERSKTIVSSIMRYLDNMVYFEIPSGQTEQDIKLSQLNDLLVNSTSRLPVVDAQSIPKYMLHESSIDKYLASDGSTLDDTFQQFLDKQKEAGFDYSLNNGYVIVSENSTLSEAKRKMEGYKSCQDIFVTKDGKRDEPLKGWMSNVRLAKYMEV